MKNNSKNKTRRTFSVGSIFEGADYRTVYDDKTGLPLYHIRKDNEIEMVQQPVQSQQEPENKDQLSMF